MLNTIFSRKTAKFLEKSDKVLAQRLFTAAQALGSEPFPHDVKRVENQFFDNEKVFRIRVGDFRILYCVSYEKRRVLVVNIDKRPRAYD